MTDKNENLELAKSIWGERIGLYHKSCAPVAVCRDGDYSGEVYLSEQMNLFIAAIESRYQAKMVSEGWRQCAKDQRTSQFCGQAEELMKKMAMLIGAMQCAIEDLAIRAKLSGDDSLNISQGCLDRMHSAISTTQPDTDAFLAGVRAEALEDFLDNEMPSYTGNPHRAFCVGYDDCVDDVVKAMRTKINELRNSAQAHDCVCGGGDCSDCPR